VKGSGILQALLTMDVVSVVSLLAVVWALDNPGGAGQDPMARHIAWGLGAALMNLIARCIAIFYFLAGGRALKDLVAEEGLDPSFVLRSKRLKRPVETVATLALIPVMVAAIGGGGIHATEDAGHHAFWAWSSVVMAVSCLAVDARNGVRHHRLLREADEALAKE